MSMPLILMQKNGVAMNGQQFRAKKRQISLEAG
jgi:hypothetical protein